MARTFQSESSGQASSSATVIRGSILAAISTPESTGNLAHVNGKGLDNHGAAHLLHLAHFDTNRANLFILPKLRTRIRIACAVASKKLSLCNTMCPRVVDLKEEIVMPKVTKKIEPNDFTAIPRWREVIKILPEEIRVCSRHGEEVVIKEIEPLLHQGGGVPFAEASWEGCCEESINRVREAVQKTLESIDRAKQTYRDELAEKLEPEHTGQFVAIELGTNYYFVGEDEVDAADKARSAGHEGALFFLRVGSPYAHRLMTPRQ